MKGWRTFGFNMVSAVLGVVASTDFVPMLSSKYAWAATVIVAIANLGLRAITTTAVGKAS